MQSEDLVLWQAYWADRSIPNRNQLALRYRQMLFGIAARRYRSLPRSSGLEMHDLVSAGSFGLLRAIERFNADRGVQFTTYATQRIRGAIADWIRSTDWAPRLVRQRHEEVPQFLSISDIARPYEVENPLVDPDAADALDHFGRQEWWDRLTAGLERGHKLILILRFREGLTLDEIGRAVGISPSRVSQLLPQILRLVRAKIDGERMVQS